MNKEEIKKFRLAAFPGKTSRQQLADRTGYEPRSIKAYELGTRKIPVPYVIILKTLPEYQEWIKAGKTLEQ